MALIDEAVSAGGGMDLWNRLTTFRVRMSIDGALFKRKGKGGVLSDVIAEGSLHEQYLKFAGFGGQSDRYATYRPGRVSVETENGKTLEARDNPQAAFVGHTDLTPWDDLHVAYFAGYANWNYLTVPFLLAGEDFIRNEIGDWDEDGQTWRRLRVRFPERIATHSPEQTFYFDRAGLLRRLDYQALDAGGAYIAHYVWAHESFSGLILPTRRKALRIGQDGKVIRTPASVEIEISEAEFK